MEARPTMLRRTPKVRNRMNQIGLSLGPSSPVIKEALALLCVVLLRPGGPVILAQQQDQAAGGQAAEVTKLTNDQLDSLVAPIALYPDPLLAQTLAASTYPLEIIQLQQWMAKHKDLKDKALMDAVQKENWDPSVQAMVSFPDAVKQLADNIKWTTDLGNAFLAQQSDVMDAVQRMRAKAKGTGNLKTTEQQKVETKVVESKQVIVIEPAQPQVVYVPSYNPTVVYGPPVYPYPPVYYPPPGYYAAGMAVSFGVGMMVGAAMSGGWGWGCGWGGNNTVNINNNNTFVNNSNRTNNVSNRSGNVSNRSGNRTGSNTWQHNPSHRGGAPYADRGTANRYGGTARGDSLSSRQANARQNIGQSGRQPSVNSRAAGGAGGGRDMAGAGNTGGGGGDRVGSRQVSNAGGSRGSGSFGGAGTSSMSSARASSQRGASSMGASRGGGGGGGRSRGGGGGGGRRR